MRSFAERSTGMSSFVWHPALEELRSSKRWTRSSIRRELSRRLSENWLATLSGSLSVFAASVWKGLFK